MNRTDTNHRTDEFAGVQGSPALAVAGACEDSHVRLSKAEPGSSVPTVKANASAAVALPLSGGERAGAAQSKSNDCTSHAAPAKLSQDEVLELAMWEGVIEKNIEAAMWFAQALGVIRAKKLYREGYCSFEQYCRERWQMTARSVRRLIDQAEVFRQLADGRELMVDGKISAGFACPASPSAVRPLIGLPPEHMRPAWDEAVRTAPNNRPTCRHVEKVVRDYQERHGLRQPDRKGLVETPLPVPTSDGKPVKLPPTRQAVPAPIDVPTDKAGQLDSEIEEAIDHLSELASKAGSSVFGGELQQMIHTLDAELVRRKQWKEAHETEA